MTTEERLLEPTDMVYELADVVEQETSSETKSNQEIIVIDGRVYERVLMPEGRVYDLVDVFEEGPGANLRKGVMGEEIRKIAAEMAEKIAREVIPGVAERVIREEIEKLKNEDGCGY